MKPIGIWETHAGIPAWASFAQMVAEYVSDDVLRWAAAFARGRQAAGLPFAWVLALTGPTWRTPMAAWLPEVAARIEASGLRPFIAAISYREEVYGYAENDTIAGIDETRAWMDAQIAVVRRQWPGVPIVGIEGFWCPTAAFGPAYYRPEYDHDIRGVEAYVSTGSTWHGDLLEPKLALACGEAVGPYRLPQKPVVVISQAFRATGPWATWVTDDTIAHTARWLAHPSVIAHWPFDWATRRATNGDVAWEGWSSWPERHKLAAWGMPT